MVDHVVVDYQHKPPVFKCLHCLKAQIIKIPTTNVRIKTEYEYFLTIHKYCLKGSHVKRFHKRRIE